MSKKILATLLMMAMVLTLIVPALAANGPQTLVWEKGFGFHCNYNGSNSQTSVEYTGSNQAVINSIKGIKKPADASNLMIVAKGDQKDYFGTKTYPITLQRVGATSRWDLLTGTDIVCVTCGSTKWVTYSNNNNGINGSNIQAHHPPFFEIVKLWDDGNPGELTALFDVYKSNKNGVRGEKVLDGVPAGKYELDEGYYLIVELEKEGYKAQPDQLIELKGTGKKITFTNYPEDPLKEQLRLIKKVVDGEAKLGIIDWLIDNGYELEEILDILFDITFELYESDADGTVGALIGIGELDTLGLITFTDPDGEYLGLDPGYYIVREVLGTIAADYFEQAPDLHIYFNGKVATDPGSKPDFDEDTTFTIVQTSMANGRKVGRLVQVVYERNDPPNGDPFYFRGPSPALFGTTFKGGFALETSQFETTQNNGDKFISFCADIGAVGVERNYVIDEDNHGLTDEEVYKLVAALDFIYNNYGLDTVDNEEGIALAQLVVWNLVLKYSSDPMIADLWATSVTGTLYKDKYGDILKIEGNTRATPPWYPVGGEYRTLINDIIEDTEKYVDIYEARIEAGDEDYIVGAAFLKGDGTRPAHYQQRQVIIWFGSVTFDNTPKEDPPKDQLRLIKKVIDGEAKLMITEWLIVNGYLEDAFAILGDITFELYESDAAGTVGDLIGIGTLDLNGVITFSDPDGEYLGLDSGYYIVREVLGPIAEEIFEQAPDLHIYFNGDVASAPNTDPDFDEDTRFTIEQTSIVPQRLVQVVYRHPVTGILYYHRTGSPAIFGTSYGGGYQLETSRFEAEQVDGDTFLSFCADIGAVGVRGTYEVDDDNHGLTDEEVYKLVAALDFIFVKYGLDNDDGISLAQLVVWNLILKYSDDPMIADLWAETLAGPLFKDLYGDLIRIEGNTNVPATWYPADGEDRALINDIIADTEKYVGIYETRLGLGVESYVAGAAFLKGDGTASAHYQQRQVLIWFGGITFDNIPKEEDPPKGAIQIEKRVAFEENGQTVDLPIHVWLGETFTPEEVIAILDGMVFKLYKVDKEGDAVAEPPLLSTSPDAHSLIVFGLLDPGWYAITEEFEGAAANLFKAPPVWYVLVLANGTSVISLTGHYEGGTVVGGGFDYSALYTVVNGYGSGYTLGYPGLNNTGDIFPIALTNVENGETYDSFCANGGSTSFHEGPGNYMVALDFRDVVTREAANGVDFYDFLKAYNYIFDNYCGEGEDLADLRAITQIVTWYLLGDLEVPSAAFDDINWAAVEAGTATVKGIPNAKAIVEDVIANYAGYKLDEFDNIVDVVFMVSKDAEQNFTTAQPQLVPIYATGYIVNKPDEDDLP